VIGEEEKKTPTLIIRKSSPLLSIVGQNLTFTFTIYNVGQSDAYSVELIDNKWNKDFKIVEGKRKAKFPVIKAGENVTYSYKVLPSKEFELMTRAAIVTFKNEEDDKEPRIARSTTLPTISITSPYEYYRRNSNNRVKKKNYLLE
jgi:hypothetical protein